MTRQLRLASGTWLVLLGFCLTQGMPQVYCLPESKFGKKEAIVLVGESARTLRSAQDTLRLVSVKLPSLVSDNLLFRKLDKEIENARDETYPGISASERLKDQPQNLRETVRLYLGLRLLEERLIALADHLGALNNPSARQLALQIMEFANKVGRHALKMHPYVYKVIDAYQAAAPPNKVDINLQWTEDDIQGPGI
ncbi:MAG: hypothetical protein HY711_03070 [Candidatus Melainabacteria bacterium]|nr:hypothetical protein [Candidatus Melainabacteria bacterium]